MPKIKVDGESYPYLTDWAMKMAKNGVCPNCNSNKLKELIGYSYGSKNLDGYKCPDCGWEHIF